jgi:hypothetical protein
MMSQNGLSISRPDDASPKDSADQPVSPSPAVPLWSFPSIGYMNHENSGLCASGLQSLSCGLQSLPGSRF